MHGARVMCGLAMALLATACAGDGGERTPVVAPMTIDEKPLWTGSTDLFNAGRRPELHGDSLIVYGAAKGKGEQDRLLVVVDAATGKPRWRVNNGDLTGDDHARVLGSNVVGGDDTWLLIAPYDPCATRAGCVAQAPADQSYGIVALSGVDGSVRWKAPLDPEQPVESIVVGKKIAISQLASGRIVATSVTDGVTLWESSGMWPQFVVGDTVLGIDAPRTDSLDPLDPTVRTESTVVALDAKTGAKKWDLADRFARSNVYQTLGDVAVIGTADEQGKVLRSRVINASSGEVVTDLGTPKRCLSDEENLLICAAEQSDELMIFDVDKRERSFLPGAARGDGVLNAWHGYLFTGEHTLDRHGTVVSEDPLGFVAAVSDRYVVTFPDTRRDSDSFAVHRIGK